MVTTQKQEADASQSGANRWFQIGLVTAGTAAPLIARWRALRANERAAEQGRRLVEQANARWTDALSWMSQANPQAQDALRQLAPTARQALERWPIRVGQSAEREPALPATVEPQRRPSATPWLIGVGVGIVVAGAVVFVIMRNRMAQQAEDESLVELSLGDIAAAQALADEQATFADLSDQSISDLSQDEEPGFATDPTYEANEGEGAAFVGNITTQVYHSADSDQLPAPEHRIYFASEAEAISAGYRRDRNELARQSAEQPGAE